MTLFGCAGGGRGWVGCVEVEAVFLCFFCSFGGRILGILEILVALLYIRASKPDVAPPRGEAWEPDGVSVRANATTSCS